jgi:hypothetical protein
MPLIEGKMVEEVFAREPGFRPLIAQGKAQSASDRTKYLRIALRLVGVTFIVGIYALTIVWPSGWTWHTGHNTPHYLQMILAVYATLGVFLLMASRNPLANLSLIWFTVWSSVAHAAVMAAQSLANPEHIAHMWGDVLALFVVAGVLAFLTHQATQVQQAD